MTPVLCYHYFGIDRSIQPGIKEEDLRYITPITDFEATLTQLKSDGYEFSLLSTATIPESERCVVTIDDAHRSVLTHAFPVMQRHAVVGVLFVVPTWVGRDGYLNWAEIQTLADHGWEIGVHGHTHRRLTTLSDSEIVQELTDARQAIQKYISQVKKSAPDGDFPPLAVPMGGISGRVERLARQQGFSYILTSHYGIWNGRSENCIPRIVVKQPYDTANEVTNLLTSGISLRSTELRLRSTVKLMRDRIIEWKQGRF